MAAKHSTNRRTRATGPVQGLVIPHSAERFREVLVEHVMAATVRIGQYIASEVDARAPDAPYILPQHVWEEVGPKLCQVVEILRAAPLRERRIATARADAAFQRFLTMHGVRG